MASAASAFMSALSLLGFAALWKTYFWGRVQKPTPRAWRYKISLPLILNIGALQITLVGNESTPTAVFAVGLTFASIAFVYGLLGFLSDQSYPRMFDPLETRSRSFPVAAAGRNLLLGIGMSVLVLSLIARAVA